MPPPQPQVHEGCDVPGHLRWDRRCRTRAGRYSHSQFSVRSAASQGGCRCVWRLRRPALRAVMQASKRAGGRRAGSTYRPRSVSSLLMRLRAMAMRVVCWRGRCCVCEVRERRWLFEEERSGLAARELALWSRTQACAAQPRRISGRHPPPAQDVLVSSTQDVWARVVELSTTGETCDGHSRQCLYHDGLTTTEAPPRQRPDRCALRYCKWRPIEVERSGGRLHADFHPARLSY
jgi:hypothetical protein